MASPDVSAQDDDLRLDIDLALAMAERERRSRKTRDESVTDIRNGKRSWTTPQEAADALYHAPSKLADIDPILQQDVKTGEFGVPTSLSERAEEVFGLDPDAKRLTVVPYPSGYGTEDIDWTDWVAPQIAVDFAKSFLLPGHVAQGGSYDIKDVIKFTLDYALPGSQTGFRRKQSSRRETVRTAPTTEELRISGGRMLEDAKKSGARLNDDDIVSLLERLNKTSIDEGIHARLHPKSTAGLESVEEILINSGDMPSLMIARRNLRIAARDYTNSDEMRIANELIRVLDDFVMKHLSDPTAAAGARGGRALWGRMKRSEIVETIIDKATLSPSFAKTLASGFRSLLHNDKRIAGFSASDIKIMRKIARGAPIDRLLSWVGSLSFGSGPLRGAAGAGAGYLVGGPAGALAAAVASQGARQIGSSNIGQRAELVRALAAHGSRPGQDVRVPLAVAPLAGALDGNLGMQREQLADWGILPQNR